MATKFSGDVGYRGIVKLGGVTLLATGGQVNINHEPIFSSGVWGAGYMNASDNVAYADNYLRLEGSFDFELTAGEGYTQVKTFAFTNRGSETGTAIVILPNGEHGFEGIGWCSSLGFDASEGGVVTCNCGFSSYIDSAEAGSNKITTGNSTNTETGASEGTLPFVYNGLYPYWATSIKKGGVLLTDITAWSASYTSEIVPLKCCGKNTGAQGTAAYDTAGAPLGPDYILIGSMSADGSYTVFKLQGDFEPSKYHSGQSMQFDMLPSSNLTGTANNVYIPKAINSSGSTSIQTGASYITAEFSFTAIGDGANPPISLDYGVGD